MTKYVLGRLLIIIPLLLAITVAVFAMLQLTPGDPLDSYLPPDQTLTEQEKANLRRTLGLDQPPVIRYFFWLGQTLQGNLGFRSKNFQPVGEAIVSHLGPTLLLMGSALLIGIVLGLSLGVLSAVKQYSILDFVLSMLAFLGISTPVFLTGLLGLYFFSLQLHWFPAGGFSTPGQPYSLLDNLNHLLLPALIVSLTFVPPIMRYTRSSMLEALSQDYIRTARAKGLAERVVIGKHTLRNALLPVVTIIGASVPSLLAGAVFTESIFSWPGMGQLFLDGVESRDYNLVMGLTLILATLVLLSNLATDIAYSLIDPRIRYGKEG
ncbi:MAG TPA: ABC transporter permease [Chloroflexia bacterium]|nr:ABC transporter permease [Chloroflexia bacterium]